MMIYDLPLLLSLNPLLLTLNPLLLTLNPLLLTGMIIKGNHHHHDDGCGIDKYDGSCPTSKCESSFHMNKKLSTMNLPTDNESC